MKFSKNTFQNLEFNCDSRKMFLLLKSNDNNDSVKNTLNVNDTYSKEQC